ncbi:cyclin B like [Cryptosporidium ryanae]|uniref:cyclin B like n=1 Tax=Cryptosporidium ryanae TaxID=515981 RepID=UPI00351A0661|nr:cyclin B like [Cryptosporidium ryanae]
MILNYGIKNEEEDSICELIGELESVIIDNKGQETYNSINNLILNRKFSENKIHNDNNKLNEKLYKYSYEHEIPEEIIKPEKIEMRENMFDKEIDIGRIIINQIILKQKEYNSHNICYFYREYYKKELENGKSLLDLRIELIEEFSNFVWKYQIKEEILFNTVNFMDNIIFKEKKLFKKITVDRIRCLSYTCFYLAVKMERVADIRSKEVCKRLKIGTEQIIDLERYIITQLSFRLNPVSSLLFLQHLMGILIESYLKEIVGSDISEIKKYCIQSQDINFEIGSIVKNDKNSKDITTIRNNWPIKTNSSALIINTLNKKSGNGVNKVLEYYIGCYILEICLYDIQTLKYSPLCQAISALLIAKECLGASIECYVKKYLYEYLNDESLVEDTINRNINTIKRILKYPFIEKISTTKKYLTNEYMNAANFVLRFIYPKYKRRTKDK